MDGTWQIHTHLKLGYFMLQDKSSRRICCLTSAFSGWCQGWLHFKDFSLGKLPSVIWVPLTFLFQYFVFFLTLCFLIFSKCFLNIIFTWVVVVHAFNHSTQEAESGGSLWVRGQTGLQSKFQDRHQSYTEKPCLVKSKKQNCPQSVSLRISKIPCSLTGSIL